MPVEPLRFAPAQATGEQALAGAVQEAFNIAIDRSGAIRRRPGIVQSDRAPTAAYSAVPVTGIVRTNDGRDLVLYQRTAGSHEVLWTSAGGQVFLGGLSGTGRPIAAHTEAMTVLAAGGPLESFELATDLYGPLSASAPNATHVAALASRILANNLGENLGRISYSDVATGPATAGHRTWTLGVGTAGFVSAEARPDRVVALYDNINEAFAFGTTNLQAFAANPQTVLFPSNTREYGCIAPYSVIKADQAFAWIDHLRRVVISDGRTYSVVSQPVQETLDGIVGISSAFGYRVHMGPIDALVWTFPADGRTLVFQPGIGWCQWAGFGDNGWKQLAITAHHQDEDTGDNYVGTSAGRLGKLSFAAADDFGESIRAHATTGYEDRGSARRKQSVAVYLTLKRGQHASPGEPVARLEWRDDFGPWQWRDISLGPVGQSAPVVDLRSLGVYRRRQWRFSFVGPEDLVLARAEEEFEVLEA